MKPNTDEELKEVELNLFYQGEEVFSGSIKELPKFSASDQSADQVKLFNKSGSEVMSMKYDEFKKVFEERLN